MADAAAAPAAPSASPTAPAGGQPTPSGPETTPAAASTAPVAPRTVKPIPSLPGVFPDDDPFPSRPSSAEGPSDADRQRTQTPPRGPDGRFVAATSSPAATAIGEHAPQPGDTPPPQPAEKFVFAGEEFASREAAEQNLRSLRGQFKPLQSLARSLGGVDKIVTRFGEAAESARGWKAEADRLRAENDALRSGKPQPASATTTAQPAEATTEAADVDWELYAEVKKLATESGEPWKAEQWLIEQVRKAERAHFDRKLDERFKPIADSQQQQAVAAQTEALFANLAEYTNSDGSPAYPELRDEAAAFEIGRLWVNLGLPPEAALTPQGAVAAIAMYRMARGRSTPQARPATATATTPAPPAPPAPTDAPSAAALDGNGRQSVLSAPGNGATPSAEAQRILAGFRQANQGNRSRLGFDA